MKIRIVFLIFLILYCASSLSSQFLSPILISDPDSTVWAKRSFVISSLDTGSILLGKIRATEIYSPIGHAHTIASIVGQADTNAVHLTRAEATALLATKNALSGDVQWTTIVRLTDTTYATGAASFVNLGQLEFNMDASGFYEIECKMFTVRATAANGWTLAMNFTQAPTNLALQATGSNAATTQTINLVDTYLDSLQMVGTTVTTGDFSTELKGFCVNVASTTGFRMRWHCELPTNVTIKRGSWLRYRRHY